MKVFNFLSSGMIYAFSGNTLEEAKNELFENVGRIDIDNVQEIPESSWDDKFINASEEDEQEAEPELLSIRDILTDEPELIFTNDLSII